MVLTGVRSRGRAGGKAPAQTWPTWPPESIARAPGPEGRTDWRWTAPSARRRSLRAPARLTPNCLAILRSISAMRTFSITCSPPATPSMLTTFLGSPVKLAARSAARVASMALGDAAGQHHIVVHRRNLDRRIGQIGLHHAGKVGDILLDADVERQNLMAVGVEEEGVGLAGLRSPAGRCGAGLRTTASTISGLETSTSWASVSSSTTAALSSAQRDALVAPADRRWWQPG